MMYYRMGNRPGYRSGHRFRNWLWLHHGLRWRGHWFGLGWSRFDQVDRHNLWLWFDRHRLRQVGINQPPDHQCLYNGTDHQRPAEVIFLEFRGLNRGGEGGCIHTFSMSLDRMGRGTEYSVFFAGSRFNGVRIGNHGVTLTKYGRMASTCWQARCIRVTHARGSRSCASSISCVKSAFVLYVRPSAAT